MTNDEPSNANFLRRTAFYLVGGSVVMAVIQASSFGSGKSLVQSVFFGLFMALVDGVSRYRKAAWRAVVEPVHPLGLGLLGLVMLVFMMLQRPEDVGPLALWEWAFILFFGAIPGYLVLAGGIELWRRVRDGQEA